MVEKHLSVLLCGCLVFCLLVHAKEESWIDPDTPLDKYQFNISAGAWAIGKGEKYTFDLIFSDEFNNSKRKFESGFDRKWTAIDQRDTSNMGQHYFLPQAVQTDKGNLVITSSKPKKKYKGAKYVSGSMQTWNKFCFTGGFVEVKAILPGKSGIPGTWPAMWIMGNIGRAAYLGSQDGTWPWSYDQCSPWVEKNQKKKQKISHCGNLTEKHNLHSRPDDYGLNRFQGRGATEIDIMEAQISKKGDPAMISTSLQISPGLYADMRPQIGADPVEGQWYKGLVLGNFTKYNNAYYGEDGLDSISALTQLEFNSFTDFHLYQLDWSPGPHGHIRWWLDGNFLFEIPGSALNVWSEGIPPRMIPVEPSYLILSTAVSEKFSPPCEGQICDSIWPSNFTIDYVRVYQGNPNEYTSIGCNPPGFPTAPWIFQHPVDYGLPWYVNLRVDIGLSHLFAIVNAIVSLCMAFCGKNNARLYTAYTSSILLTSVFYALFSVNVIEKFGWIHAFIAGLCGIVFGSLVTLIPIAALGGMFGLYLGMLLTQFSSSIILCRITVGVLLGIGLCTHFSMKYSNPKHVLIVSTASLGSFGFLISLSKWISDADIGMNAWNRIGFVLGGFGYSGDYSMCTEECVIMYLTLLLLTIAGVIYQYYDSKRIPLYKNIGGNKGKSNSPNISASSDARAWKPEEGSSSKINFFSPTAMPSNMQQFSTIFQTALNVQQYYGFQVDSFRNQTEHIVMLLCNLARKGGNPYRKLHDLVFGNYTKWCRKLRIPSVTWNPEATVNSAVEEISVDLCLFFFIWGEASNLRHCPEYMCFLFHKLKEEYPTAKRYTREAGHFLDTVITPVYSILKSEMGSDKDHQDRRNYDDFNEFFWSSECLKYDYKYEHVNDHNVSPNPMGYYSQKGSGSLGGAAARANIPQTGRKSVAEAYVQSSKSFLEKRTWLTPLRAFRRIMEFHIITFHFLAVLAFAIEKDLTMTPAFKIISSVLITPFLLSMLWDVVDIAAVYCDTVHSSTLVRHVTLVILHLFLTTMTMLLYWYAWNYDGKWWATFYSTALFLHIPTFFNALLQILPGFTNALRRTQWKPVSVVRDFINPMNKLYVGDNVLDPASESVGYQLFWSSMILWKLFFSYKFVIAPLVTPTMLLYADHIENHVSLITTGFLILLQWFPFFLIFCIDITIWNAIWVAFTGTFTGFSARIGEIRNFERVRVAFSRAADAFNSKIIPANSKTGLEIADSLSSSSNTRSAYGCMIGNEVLDRVAVDDTSSIIGRSGHSDETPLLSFSRRKQTAEELKNKRRQKWLSFSVAWDNVIDTMRADDLISNCEKSLLHFQRIDGYQREIYLPQFQLAGCFENFASTIFDLYRDGGNDLSERELQDKLLDLLGENPMLEEAVEEIWELMIWVMLNILGPCHTNDVRFIASTFNSWASKGIFRAINLRKVAACGSALADLLSLVKNNIGTWKKNAKFIPIRKSPSDYSSYQFPNIAAHQRPAGTGGLTKSASTTGLSSLGGNVPRRSRGSGVARIAAMQQSGSKPKDSKLSGQTPHSIPAPHIMQIRDKLRTFLNLVKGMLNTNLDERDVVLAESKGISDRLTWILTQERGFMWDDDYTGEQITLTAFERHSSIVVNHLHGLLTLQRIEAEPRSYDARRRLLFFVNSLFMDMPVAPLLEEMKSWSVMTPFYGEDVLYSKSDLESKQDGLDVHTLLYLQTLYKKDWENFLERVKPKKNLWKDPNTAMELRLWASLRGQTLARTVQGMMYGEAALRVLAEIEQIPVQRVEELVKTKFNYVVACQIYGRQKRNNDSKAKDIEFLLHRFPNLRVSYIDEVRVNYQKEQSYFAVLIKSGEELGTIHEVYRVRLPGNPILGEGKPENQNSAIIFTRGENLQTIDMNQDGYLEEQLKMRNLLEEFDTGSESRPYTIVGLPEHIFTGSVSSLANYMALQETSFVTLGQRTLAKPLRVRLHYGHPDVFNKLFFMTRGGISKASKGINLSEDIFAGYNNCLRGGSVKFPEYVKCGKGRDVGMQQIYKFEAKLAQGAAEQSLSRDVYRISQRLDFFKLLSFYYNHVGFYLSMSLIIWAVYVLVYCNLLRCLLSLEGVGGRTPVILSRLQVMLGSVAFFTTAPLLATISVERGFKAAVKEVLMIFVTGGPLYFLFHIGTKWFYFGQTILAGGAKYRATGRGFVTKHSRFDELYRFYASSHLYAGTEIAAALILYRIFAETTQYFALTWSLWLVVVSWSFSAFWFNPLAFEWSDVVEDIRSWLRWMKADGGNANQSWEAWFKEENAYFSTLKPWAKVCVTLKGLLFAIVAISIASTGDPYHSLLKQSTWLPFLISFSLVALYFIVSILFLNSQYGESGLVRFMKLILVLLTSAGFILAFIYVEGMWECILSTYYLGAAIGCLALLVLGSNSRLVAMIYFIHDIFIGVLFLTIIVFLSALYVPGKIQTWLLYNNALSRGVVIEDILRANSSNDDKDDEMSLQQMRTIIIEQQRVISALTSGSDSDSSNPSNGSGGSAGGSGTGGSGGNSKREDITHTLSDNALNNLRNVSETELNALHEASKRLQAIVCEEEKKEEHSKMTPSISRVRRAYSTSDSSTPMMNSAAAFAASGLPPFATAFTAKKDNTKQSIQD